MYFKAALPLLLVLSACGGGPGLQIAPDRVAFKATGRPSIRVAAAAMAGGLPETALAVTRGLLEKNPRDVAAMVTQGDALRSLDRLPAARESYQRALTINPKSAAALLALGRMDLAAGEPAQAEEMFRRQTAVASGLEKAQGQNNRGIALDMLDRHIEAQASYQAALQIAPDMVGAKTNLGLSYALSGDPTSAIGILQPLAADPAASEKTRTDYLAAVGLAGSSGTAAKDASPPATGKALR